MIDRILSKIFVPIVEANNMIKVTESCLENDGQNRSHSRNVKMDDYHAPVNGHLTSEEEEKIEQSANILILKSFAKKYLKELRKINADLSMPVSLYFPEISGKQLTGNDLEILYNYNYEELLEYNRTHKKDDLSKIILTFFLLGGGSKLGAEHYDSRALYKDKSIEEGETLFWGYSKRIYMNLPRSSAITYEFGLLYALKCIEKGIPYDMKLLGSQSHGDSQLDGTILYSKNKYFSAHIDVINEILLEHPEYKQYMGTPIYTAGHIIDEDGKCYMAISHAGGPYYAKKKALSQTYNDTADCIINFTYLYSCCKLIKRYSAYFANKFDRDTFIKIQKLDNNMINVETLDHLKAVEPVVREKIYIFMCDKNKHGQYDETIEQLNYFMTSNIQIIGSLVNFGSTEYANEPIYKDPSFLLYEQNHLNHAVK